MKSRFQALPVRRVKAFSLIEILAVIAIIGILVTISVPMLRSPGRAFELKSVADNLKGQIELARQEAVTLSGAMEIRFYQKNAGQPFTAYQIYSIDGDGNRKPYSKLQVLSQGFVFSQQAELSPLLTQSTLKGKQADGAAAVRDWDYSAVVIGSSGIFADVAQDQAFVTVMESSAPIVANKRPANYAVVKLQPLTGMVSVTQP
jgi:uncharacterized protein (TIGR02596 family)